MIRNEFPKGIFTHGTEMRVKERVRVRIPTEQKRYHTAVTFLFDLKDLPIRAGNFPKNPAYLAGFFGHPECAKS
jgi:hypothetical protein